MWIADGDFNIPIPGGISGIVIAAIVAIAGVLVTLLRRRSPEREPEAIREAAKPAVQAGVDAATTALAAILAQRDARIRKLEGELDEAYRAGFKSTRTQQGAPGD